ncbi:MAG: tyrosine-type recombinase/integrase [Firmicutes bacterium]|nr:tyrosine-type recombinase/integrase [Bacillota bacterium]
MGSVEVVRITRGAGLAESTRRFLITIPPGNTRRSYGSDLELFYDFLAIGTQRDASLGDIGIEHVAAFRDHEMARGVSPATLRRRLAALRAFFAWAVDNGLATHNPARNIALPRAENGHFTVLAEDEVYRLLQMPDLRRTLGRRDKAMLVLNYVAGLRVGELCNLKLNDIVGGFYFKHSKKPRPAVIVRDGKGGKSRDIPIDPWVLEEVEKWRQVRPEAGHDYLFTTKDGVPMNPPTYRHALRKYAKRAGIGKDVTPHTLRHSFATHLAQRGQRLDVIAEYLGHADLKTVSVYAHRSDEEYVEGVASIYKGLLPKRG